MIFIFFSLFLFAPYFEPLYILVPAGDARHPIYHRTKLEGWRYRWSKCVHICSKWASRRFPTKSCVNFTASCSTASLTPRTRLRCCPLLNSLWKSKLPLCSDLSTTAHSTAYTQIMLLRDMTRTTVSSSNKTRYTCGGVEIV